LRDDLENILKLKTVPTKKERGLGNSRRLKTKLEKNIMYQIRLFYSSGREVAILKSHCKADDLLL
jgi:hypothetical protein